MTALMLSHHLLASNNTPYDVLIGDSKGLLISKKLGLIIQLNSEKPTEDFVKSKVFDLKEYYLEVIQYIPELKLTVLYGSDLNYRSMEQLHFDIGCNDNETLFVNDDSRRVRLKKIANTQKTIICTKANKAHIKVGSIVQDREGHNCGITILSAENTLVFIPSEYISNILTKNQDGYYIYQSHERSEEV